MNIFFTELRKEHQQQSLYESEVVADPRAQFQKRFEPAAAAQAAYPEALALATAGLTCFQSEDFVFAANASPRQVNFANCARVAK